MLAIASAIDGDGRTRNRVFMRDRLVVKLRRGFISVDKQGVNCIGRLMRRIGAFDRERKKSFNDK